jgi:hypothetical protein
MTMREDIWLLAVVFAIWAVSALLYAFVPMFHMPGYAGVWGWGAAIFLVLAAIVAVAQRRAGGHRRKRLANPWHRK